MSIETLSFENEPTVIAERPQSAVKRIRLFDGQRKPRSHILGVTSNAEELFSSKLFQKFLTDGEYEVLDVDLEALPEAISSTTDKQIEIRPPLSDEHLEQLGELCVNGTFVPDWGVNKLNVEREGVCVSDNRSYLPHSRVDSGPYVLGSSLIEARQMRQPPALSLVS